MILLQSSWTTKAYITAVTGPVNTLHISAQNRPNDRS